MRKKILGVILTIFVAIILFTITIYCLNNTGYQLTKRDYKRIDREKVKILDTFKNDKNSFKKVCKFAKSQGYTFFHVGKDYENTDTLIVQGNNYKKLEEHEYKDIREEINRIIYEYGFSDIYANSNIGSFSKSFNKGIRQGLAYYSDKAPNDDDFMFSEQIENDWYYFINILE